jgi:hypothetical protein
VGKKRNELDGRLRQAVDTFLLMLRIVAPRQEAQRDEPLQPVRQDVRRNPFLGVVQELPVVAPVAKHDVPDDDQTPTIPEHLEREIDRAPGPMCILHLLQPRPYCCRTACTLQAIGLPFKRLQYASRLPALCARRRFFAAE